MTSLAKLYLGFSILSRLCARDQLISRAISFFPNGAIRNCSRSLRSLENFFLFPSLKNLLPQISTSLEQIKQLNLKILDQILQVMSYYTIKSPGYYFLLVLFKVKLEQKHSQICQTYCFRKSFQYALFFLFSF